MMGRLAHMVRQFTALLCTLIVINVNNTIFISILIIKLTTLFNPPFL